MRPVRLGTRRSHLAVTQSGHVAAMIRDLGHEVELVEIVSDGDRSQASGQPLTGTSSTGVFVSALRDALLAGEIDVAVHSLKDLPTYPQEGVTLVAIPPREDPRDVVRCSVSRLRTIRIDSSNRVTRGPGASSAKP